MSSNNILFGYLNIANTIRDPLTVLERINIISDTIKQSNITTVFLAEAMRPITKDGQNIPWSTIMDKLLSLLPGWKDVGFIKNNDTSMSFGICVLTKTDTITSIEPIVLSTFGFGTKAMKCLINGQPVLAVHFPIGKDAREQALANVIEQIKISPNIIVIGDCNDFLDENIEMEQKMELVNYKSIITQKDPTFVTYPDDLLPYDKRKYVIDYVISDTDPTKMNVISSLDRVFIPKDMDLTVTITSGVTGESKYMLEVLLEEYKSRASDHFLITCKL